MLLSEEKRQHKVARLVDKLWNLGCIRLAKPDEPGWTLKSGEKSRIYVDLRTLPQHYTILSKITRYLMPFFTNSDYVGGLPLGGIPFATIFSSVTGIPQILIRKEAKNHGTGKFVEIDYDKWDGPKTITLIDDVLTSGNTIRETIEMFSQQQIPLIVTSVICIVNRSNSKTVPGTNIPVVSLVTIDQILPMRMAFSTRSQLCSNPITKKLFHLMHTKKTNLCLSADFSDVFDITNQLDIFEQIAPHIVAVKLHDDILSPSLSNGIRRISSQYNVIILSDDKFADIGSIVSKKLLRHDPADMFTIHALSGPGGIKALGGRAILVAEMSNDGNLASKQYAKATALMASEENVVGFVCQTRSHCEAGNYFVYMTPGVNESETGDGNDQRYRNCYRAIVEQKNDLVIVGRGIFKAKDPVAAAIMYRNAAWAAYEMTITEHK